MELQLASAKKGAINARIKLLNAKRNQEKYVAVQRAENALAAQMAKINAAV